MNRRLLVILMVTILFLLIGCTKQAGIYTAYTNQPDEDYWSADSSNYFPSSPLRVATFFSENGPLANLLSGYKELYPAQTIEVIKIAEFFSPFDIVGEDHARRIESLLEDERIDLVILPQNLYHAMADINALHSLEHLWTSYDLDRFHTTVIQLLTGNGSYELSGLSPLIHSNALVINISLLNQKNVPLNEDLTTWSSLYDFTSRFKEKAQHSGIYGLTFSSIFNHSDFLFHLQTHQGLQVLNAATGNVQMTAEEWRFAYNFVFQSTAKGITIYSDPEQPAMYFADGSAAIMLANTSAVSDLASVSFEWTSVPVPVDDGVTSYGLPYMPYVFAVPGSSNKTKDAEYFIQVVNSQASIDQLFNDGMNTYLYGIPARKRVLDQYLEERLTGFLPETLPEPVAAEDHAVAPKEFYEKFSILRSEAHENIVNGSLTIDQALLRLQEEGQRALHP